ASNSFFHQDLRIVAQGFGQGGTPVRHPIDKLQSDAGTLPHRFEDHRRLPAHRPTGLWRVKHGKSRRRNPSFQTTLLGEHLVESESTSSRAAPRLRHSMFSKPLLTFAVLSICAIEREKHCICRWQKKSSKSLEFRLIYR